VARALFRSVGKSTAPEACDRLVVAVRELRDAWATIAGDEKVVAGSEKPAVPMSISMG
jgi:hypothetical protein